MADTIQIIMYLLGRKKVILLKTSKDAPSWAFVFLVMTSQLLRDSFSESRAKLIRHTSCITFLARGD